MELSPIVIFTFNRLEHTQKMIEALKENYLASESEVFIFSDGYRNSNEKLLVDKVRNYIKTINGFKKIHIVEAEKNNGLAKSVIEGVTKIINNYNKVIVLEDDLVTSKYFLTYMNNALNIYEKRKDIWSVSGYTPNINIPNDYVEDIYLTKRACSWGWATWRDRWELNDWEVKDYKNFKRNRTERKNFNQSGSDMSPMLNDQMEGRISSWAIRWCYNQFKNDCFTIYPIKSLVTNIGMDLSGTHSVSKPQFVVELNNYELKLNVNISPNKEISKSFKKVYNLDSLGYLAIAVKKIGLYKKVRTLRNKLLISKLRY